MTAVARPGTKPRIDEDLFRPRNLEEARQLRRALTDAGVRPSLAWSVVGWLLEEPEEWVAGRTGAHVTRSQYRSILLELGEPPWAGHRASVGSRDKGAYIRSIEPERPRLSRLLLRRNWEKARAA